MFALALQIYFTVRAFRNGWRGRAFIPWALVLGLSLAVGFLSGLQGYHAADFGSTALLP